MASPVKFSMVIACVMALVMVVAAQNNGEDGIIKMSGMVMGAPAPTPQSSASPPTLTYSAAILIFLPFMLYFVVAKWVDLNFVNSTCSWYYCMCCVGVFLTPIVIKGLAFMLLCTWNYIYGIKEIVNFANISCIIILIQVFKCYPRQATFSYKTYMVNGDHFDYKGIYKNIRFKVGSFNWFELKVVIF